MSDQRQLLALARCILGLPAPFRDRLLHLLLLWHSVPEAVRDDATKRLAGLGKTPNEPDAEYKELLTQLDRVLEAIKRSKRKR
jgi:hypothetical protein